MKRMAGWLARPSVAGVLSDHRNRYAFCGVAALLLLGELDATRARRVLRWYSVVAGPSTMPHTLMSRIGLFTVR